MKLSKDETGCVSFSPGFTLSSPKLLNLVMVNFVDESWRLDFIDPVSLDSRITAEPWRMILHILEF
jgi:hypothetical protein